MKLLYVLLYTGTIVSANSSDIISIHSITSESNTHHKPSLVYLFAHGMQATQEQGITSFSKYIEQTPEGIINSNERWLMSDPIILFNFLDAKSTRDFHNAWVNLGQHIDMERLHSAYLQTREKFPESEIILVGLSRGAATVLNYVSLYKPEHIKALVLESPFDTLKSIVKQLLHKFHVDWLPYSYELSLKLIAKRYPLLNQSGPFPIDVIHQIPQHLPIILIHSHKDTVIPINSSRLLYCELRKSDHHHVYLVELFSGSHGKLLKGKDGHFYYCMVHTFYKKYGLPYDAECVKHSEHLFLQCQPSVTEVMKRIKNS